MNNIKWVCKDCNLVFQSKNKLDKHRKLSGEAKVRKVLHTCEYCGETFYNKRKHNKECIKRPRGPHRDTPEERKLKSEKLKKAYREDRHHGWANTRKNRYGMSYPEKWFSSVIQNEFTDKDYEYNLPIGKYKVDFAWPKKMRYIEIDGQQHDYTVDYDISRDNWICSQGWKCLRVKWKDICNNKQYYIELLKDFIDNGSEMPYNEFLEKRKKELKEKEEKKKKFINEDMVDSIGRFHSKMVPMSEWLRRKELILNSCVNLGQFGCLTKLEVVTGLSRRQIKSTMTKFNIEYKSHS